MGETVVMGLSTPTTDGVLLRSPSEAEASVLVGWSLSAAETKRWCSSDEHPVSSERVLSWWQPAAVRCYRASGFRRLDAERNAVWNMGQPAPYIWMELAR